MANLWGVVVLLIWSFHFGNSPFKLFPHLKVLIFRNAYSPPLGGILGPFTVLADPSMDWNPACLGILDLVSCGGCYNLCHSDTLVESQSARLFAGLLFEVSDYIHKDLYLYGSFELMVLFFELTMVCGLMCQNWSPGSDFAPPAVAHAELTIQDCTVPNL